MPRSKPCPECGRLAEVKTYVVPTGKPLLAARAPAAGRAASSENLEDLDAWECECGWAEDVEP